MGVNYARLAGFYSIVHGDVELTQGQCCDVEEAGVRRKLDSVRSVLTVILSHSPYFLLSLVVSIKGGRMSKQRLLTGHEVEPMSEEWLTKMAQEQSTYEHGVVRILPDGWLYPGTTPRFLNRIQSFKFRPDDVLVMTFPKSGTTWMQEILWTMLFNPNLDNPQATQPLLVRSADLSVDMMFDTVTIDEIRPESMYEAFKKLCPGKDEEDGIAVQCLDAMPGQRVIKCHYPFDLMPPDLLDKTKVVYVARNPKDMVVSFYHFYKVIKVFDYKGSLDSFIKLFMDNGVIYSPYWPHIKQGWQKRNHPNLHFVFYEDLKADPQGEIQKINQFLATGLTEQQLKNVVQHTSFSSMKSRGDPLPDQGIYNKELHQSSGGFYRKGVTGDWKNHFSQELNHEMDKWIKDNIGDSGIPFKMD
ncbi:hypothetical protein Pmani_008888 [Petrolisthes manimaculis]|uniref:Sulfotransferase domain-containing protein n=1 Tax=Petrolisthes manimaculis TaxID=1843537 RepID=A0AAE1UE66_9EUCA|nr:hypothetical protein Pmani_008888 [Petrolisthes manimaculis]